MHSLDPTELHFAYFAYEPLDQTLRLRCGVWRDTEGSSLDACPTDPDVWFRLGEEEGLVGQVAQDAQPVYVSDASDEPRWEQGYGLRSALLIPLAEEGPCDVLVLFSHELDGFDEGEQALAIALIRYLSKAYRAGRRDGARVEQLEHGLRRIALELSELGVDRQAGDLGYPAVLADRLKLVSPREWQVLERLREGLRVATIARELTISPNTVRNHLKSIYRKLGVRSQTALLELLRGRQAEPESGQAPDSERDAA